MPYVVGLNLLLLSSYAVGYSIFALRSFTLVLSGDICYVTYTMESPLRGPDSRVIRTTPSHYIVRLTEGLMYVAAVRSNDNFVLFICFIVRVEFASITGHYSLFLNRAAESVSGPPAAKYLPPPLLLQQGWTG